MSVVLFFVSMLAAQAFTAQQTDIGRRRDKRSAEPITVEVTTSLEYNPLKECFHQKQLKDL
ncbi:hypothetical protein OESDEN_11343, partial [Oesophagostomum dentatum]